MLLSLYLVPVIPLYYSGSGLLASFMLRDDFPFRAGMASVHGCGSTGNLFSEPSKEETKETAKPHE